MNNKRVKFELIAGLLNLAPTRNVTEVIKGLVQNMNDAGKFLGKQLVGQKSSGDLWLNKAYALRFEHLTVSVDVLSDKRSEVEIVRNFQIS